MEKIKVAGWLKPTKNGGQFLSLKIEIGSEIHYANLFRNNKTKDTQPDYRTIDDKPKEPSNDIEQKPLPDNDSGLPF